MNIMENNETDRLLDDMENIQMEMQEFIDHMKKTKSGKNLSYDGLKDIFFIKKIAELEHQLKS